MVNLKLVGSSLSKLSAFRNQKFSGKVSLATNIKILSMELVDGRDALKVQYSFEVDYKDLGNIYVEGNLFVSSDDDGVLKKILSSWDDKSFQGDENAAITNMILQKASIKCFSLEEEFGLPPHIKLPTVNLPAPKE